MHIKFNCKKYGLRCQFDIKELPTNTQLDEIQKEIRECIRSREESGNIHRIWQDFNYICAEALTKRVSLGHNTLIATIEI